MRLSIQDVGVNAFIQWLVQELPSAIQTEAASLLLSLVPATPDFIGIQYFVNHPQLKKHTLAAALLHRLYTFHQLQLFSATAETSFELATALKEHACICLDISQVPAGLLPIAYEAFLRLATQQTQPPALQWVWVAPEIIEPYLHIFLQN